LTKPQQRRKFSMNNIIQLVAQKVKRETALKGKLFPYMTISLFFMPKI